MERIHRGAPGAEERHVRRTAAAVVGSGVAGLTAAYILGRTGHVTLYEADDRLGGHAHTHELTSSYDGRVHRVDSGFIVHNRRTCPNLLRLFDELGVATQESGMSMSVQCEAVAWSTPERGAPPDCSPGPARCCGAGICGCSPRCPPSTGRHGGCWPTAANEAAYTARTSGFLPRPPKRSGAGVS